MNIVIDNEVWCELEVENCVCQYKFLLLNIPCYIGGHKQTGYGDDYWQHNWREVPPEVVKGEIFCDSDHDAKQCASSIQELIENGYRDRSNGWLVGMDMGDIFMQFNGKPMNFLYKSFTESLADTSLKYIQKRLKNASEVCCFLVCPEKDVRLDEIDIVFNKISPNGDAKMIWQFCLSAEIDRKVNVWYR